MARIVPSLQLARTEDYCYTLHLHFIARSRIFLHTPQPRSQSSSAISDVTSPVKLVGKIRLGRLANNGKSKMAYLPGFMGRKTPTTLRCYPLKRSTDARKRCINLIRPKYSMIVAENRGFRREIIWDFFSLIWDFFAIFCQACSVPSLLWSLG